MSQDDARIDELAAQDAELLPDREVMSLLSTGSPLAIPTTDGLPGMATPAPETDPAGGTASGAAGQASGTANDVATDAAASGGGEETVTSGNRDDTITRSDSAQAGP
jgi:hypothetical protein